MVDDKPFLAFYEDEKGTLRIFKLKKDKPEDAVHAGRTSESIILWAKNITGNDLFDVHIIVADKEVEVIPSVIQKLEANEMVKVMFVWRPSLDRRTALKTKLNSTATEIIKPK